MVVGQRRFMMIDEDRKGGRGKCRYCGQWENNVSFHEEWECFKRLKDLQMGAGRRKGKKLG